MGSGDGGEGLRAAAVSLDDAQTDAARLGFYRAHPKKSAKRVLYITQGLVFTAIAAALIYALIEHTTPALRVLHLGAWLLFAAAILWRFAAAAYLSPILSRLATPQTWPLYTILCPLYREANVTPDLVSALQRLDYPGLMHQRVKCDTIKSRNPLRSCGAWNCHAPSPRLSASAV